MSTKVSMCVERTVEQIGHFEFSTEHKSDIVEKWLVYMGKDKRDHEFENEIEYWDDNYSKDEETYASIDSIDEGEGNDYCTFDNEIQRWIDENTVDMNLIFSSGCDIQKITDFIKKNEELYNSLSKKKVVSDLTEDEKEVFYGLRKIAGLED